MSSGLTYLLWNDLVGMTRTRGIPTADLEWRLEAGLGWACAGQALTPFEDIVDNAWGPMDEARQIPDPETLFTIPASGDHPAISAVICDSRLGPDQEWDCCTRTFLRRALDDLHAQTRLTLRVAYEHEFSLTGVVRTGLGMNDRFRPETGFSFAAARLVQPLLLDLHDALTAAGVRVETVEPEYGLGQYEVSCAPEPALRAADGALVAREVVREVARRHDKRASFTPKPTLDAVGNGAHTHMSLTDANGVNATYDADGPLGLSPVAAQFAAGIIAHAEALVAITAPAPVSYYRLGPHHWSCGFTAIGLQNREAAVRVVHGSGRGDAARNGTNLEYRPADGVASPYLALGALVRAGLDGIARALPLPPPAEIDPAEMSEAERERAGIRPLPKTLGDALEALERDEVARGWFPERMRETYLAIKRWEVAQAAEADQAKLFARYRTAY